MTMVRKSLFALVWVVTLLAFPATVYACPMCKDAVEANLQLAATYNLSIIVLVGLPFALVTVVTAHTARALNPPAYAAMKQRAQEFLWPRGWVYLSSALAALALLFYVTTPPDPATRLRLPYLSLETQPAAIPDRPLPQLEGRVVVVTFFASWCSPCVEQLADLTQLQHEFEDAGVVIVAINAFEDYTTPPGVPHLHSDGTFEFHIGAPDLPSFLAANHFTMPVMTATPALSASFGGVARIPTTFIFDPTGRLVTRYVNQVRGEFVRPKLDEVRGDMRRALTCGPLALQVIRDTCAFFVR